MIRKLALGFVAAATIATAALAPTAASAHPWGFGGGWGGWGFHHPHFGIGLGYIGVADACYVRQTVMTPYGYRLRLVNVCY
jgi:hypothetical protein